MLGIIRFVFFLLILLLSLSFALLNAETVTLNYYLGDWEIPLSLALVMAMALGALFGVVACLSLLLGLKREVSKLRKTAKPPEIQTMGPPPIKDIR